ncbi:MAG: hypothetical protein ABIM42_01050 [candidate division WOR-3 bacterium]
MHISTNFWVWIQALLTLAIFTFLYKDNPIFRFAEHLFVGIATGYGLVIVYKNAFLPNLFEPLFVQKQFVFIVPFLLGLLYFTFAVPKVSYLMRWPMAFLLGVGSGLSIPLSMKAYIFEQLSGSILRPPYPNLAAWVNALILFFGVIVVLFFFYFSVPHERPGLKQISKAGLLLLMLGFGASFGYTVMARLSLLVGRLNFLLTQWLGIKPY